MWCFAYNKAKIVVQLNLLVDSSRIFWLVIIGFFPLKSMHRNINTPFIELSVVNFVISSCYYVANLVVLCCYLFIILLERCVGTSCLCKIKEATKLEPDRLFSGAIQTNTFTMHIIIVAVCLENQRIHHKTHSDQVINLLPLIRFNLLNSLLNMYLITFSIFIQTVIWMPKSLSNQSIDFIESH